MSFFSIPMKVWTFVTSFSGILLFTLSIKSLLNGVNLNDAPVSKIITALQGSWYVLEPRRLHSTFARAVHVLLWLTCMACWLLTRIFSSLAFIPVLFLSWNFEINLGSIVKSLKPQKLSNMYYSMVSCNVKWESLDNWKFDSGLITHQSW